MPRRQRGTQPLTLGKSFSTRDASGGELTSVLAIPEGREAASDGDPWAAPPAPRSAAGEAGRGFAVVAGEVRRLAERSVASTGSIREIIGSVQDEVLGRGSAGEGVATAG